MHGVVHKFSASDYVNFAGNYTKELVIILRGSINVIAQDETGRDAIIASLSRGSVICERLLDEAKHNAEFSYLVASDSEILIIPIDNLENFADTNGVLAKFLLNVCLSMADDSMRLLEKIEIVSQKYLRDKIIAYLRLQALEQKKSKVVVPFNRSQLAEYLNADRSSMTRELYLMKEAGLIDFTGNVFEIKFKI